MTTPSYRCLIVDDEVLARELVETHLAQLPQFELVASCSSAIEASRVLATESVDLMFLDIEMPVLKGTDFYKGLAQRPKAIFTTAYRDYALDGFDLEAIDYLLKPITFARFFKAIERFLASQRVEQQDATRPRPSGQDYVFVRVNRKDLRLMLKDIDYVQGLKDYIRVHAGGSVHVVKETMASVSQRLGDDFIRVHRSYLVNRWRVTALTSHDVELGELEIPIGETYRRSALSILKT
ncbi:MAG: LytR/AlgR family response regulator transcription factor [Lysobacterales bacterium]